MISFFGRKINFFSTSENRYRKKLISEFKNVSIRGRMAYGIVCLENFLKQQDVKHELFETLILPRLWAFTDAKDLSDWDKKANEIDPVCVLENELSKQDFDWETISFDVYRQLYEVYFGLSFDLIETISLVIQIGEGNLYGGTGHESPITLGCLERVVEKCQKNRIELPGTARFQMSKFSEEHGWGLERPKSDFI